MTARPDVGTTTPAVQRLRRLARESVLTIGALLGVGCLIVGIAMVAFGITALVFRSGSMSPDYPTGSVAFARTVPAQSVNPGDVVSVVDGAGTRITHRVEHTRREAGESATIILRGDANTVTDATPYVVASADRVIGPAVPYAGYVLTWVQTPTGLIVLLGAVGGLLYLGFRSPRQPSGNGNVTAATSGASPATHTADVVAILAVAAMVAFVGAGSDRTLAAFTDTATAQTGVFRAVNFDPLPTTMTCESGFLGLTAVGMSWSAQTGTNYIVYVVQNGVAVATISPASSPQEVGTRQLESGLLLNAGNATVQLRTIRNGVVSNSYVSHEIYWTRVLVLFIGCRGSSSTGSGPPPSPRSARVGDQQSSMAKGAIAPSPDDAVADSPTSPTSPTEMSPSVSSAPVPESHPSSSPPNTSEPAPARPETGQSISPLPAPQPPVTTTESPAPTDSPLGAPASSGTGYSASLVQRVSGAVEVVIVDGSGDEVASVAGQPGDALRWVDGDLWIIGGGDSYTRLTAPGWTPTRNVPLDEVPSAVR